MEREFLVIRNASGIASIYLSFLIGIEVFVGRVFLPEFLIGHIHRLVVFHQPIIGVDGLFEHGLETERLAGGATAEQDFADLGDELD